MINKSFNGTFAVLMTPFSGNRVDYGAYERQVHRLSGTGVAGYVVNGSTAEFVHLTREEKENLVEIVCKNREEGKKVIVSACETTLPNTYNVVKHAWNVGADALLVCPPYYFQYKNDEIKKYYTDLADISPVPIILYNIPFFTQPLDLGVIYDLMKHPNIVGIKDSSGNMKRIMHLIDMAKDTTFSVMTGTDDMLLPAFVGGCSGSMTALASIFPNKISAIYYAIKAGKIEEARELQHSIMAALRRADSETFPRGYKRLMEEVSEIKFGDREV